jgi:hypothetical protein
LRCRFWLKSTTNLATHAQEDQRSTAPVWSCRRSSPSCQQGDAVAISIVDDMVNDLWLTDGALIILRWRQKNDYSWQVIFAGSGKLDRIDAIKAFVAAVDEDGRVRYRGIKDYVHQRWPLAVLPPDETSEFASGDLTEGSNFGRCSGRPVRLAHQMTACGAGLSRHVAPARGKR